jgi:hypothetical protein
VTTETVDLKWSSIAWCLNQTYVGWFLPFGELSQKQGSSKSFISQNIYKLVHTELFGRRHHLDLSLKTSGLGCSSGIAMMIYKKCYGL